MNGDYPIKGQTYKHYKGGTYTVLALALHSETKEPMVVYINHKYDSTWVRPRSEWIKPVDRLPGVKRFAVLPHDPTHIRNHP